VSVGVCVCVFSGKCTAIEYRVSMAKGLEKNCMHMLIDGSFRLNYPLH